MNCQDQSQFTIKFNITYNHSNKHLLHKNLLIYAGITHFRIVPKFTNFGGMLSQYSMIII